MVMVEVLVSPGVSETGLGLNEKVGSLGSVGETDAERVEDPENPMLARLTVELAGSPAVKLAGVVADIWTLGVMLVATVAECMIVPLTAVTVIV
jgi:hypothetical protein